MNEPHELREQHKAELLLPTGKAISCENCFSPMENEVGLNWHTTLCGSPIVIEQMYCEKCLDEVIIFRHRIRNVAEMTTELVSKANYQKLHQQEYDKLGKIKHL